MPLDWKDSVGECRMYGEPLSVMKRPYTQHASFAEASEVYKFQHRQGLASGPDSECSVATVHRKDLFTTTAGKLLYQFHNSFGV